MNELVKIEHCELTPTKLSIRSEVDLLEWKRIGHMLCRCQGSLQWWIGDWINHGETAYGQKYKGALKVFGEEAMGEYGYTPDALRNYSSVASRVVIRITTLSWTHHWIVAPMPAKEQKRWLELAAKNKWSVKQLKEAIKEEYCDPLAGVSHETSFSWLAWVTQGERWLSSELKGIGAWGIERLEAVKRDLDRIVPLKMVIDAEYEKRVKQVEGV